MCDSSLGAGPGNTRCPLCVGGRGEGGSVDWVWYASKNSCSTETEETDKLEEMEEPQQEMWDTPMAPSSEW